MGDFLQLSVKRRETKEGFLDSLTIEYNRYKNRESSTGTVLKEKVEAWLIEEGVLTHSDTDSIDPLSIGDVVMNRICEIAGHVWIEFVENADVHSIRGVADSRSDSLEIHVAEFLPESFEVDLLFDAFNSEDGRVYWKDVTDTHLVRLFAELLEESNDNRRIVTHPDRAPSGAVKGYVGQISPAQLMQYSDSWFADRRAAYVTPAWSVAHPNDVVTTLKESEPRLRYSLTPEYYQSADNCVTWASRVLDSLVPGDWIESLRIECGIDPNALADRGCQDYHIREHGHMRCVVRYAQEADRQRKGGLTTFDRYQRHLTVD
jgi:hypothetical protein